MLAREAGAGKRDCHGIIYKAPRLYLHKNRFRSDRKYSRILSTGGELYALDGVLVQLELPAVP